jgi:RimJ/RimL family protein N-acetyltransferase
MAELSIKYLNPLDEPRDGVSDELVFLNRVRNAYAKEFLHNSETFSLEETIDWFNGAKFSMRNPNGYWIIRDKDSMIGYFRISEYSRENKRLMIGADIAPEFTGRGFATKAYKQMLWHLFDRNDLHKISLEVLSTNLRAINLYMKLGFVVEGTKRDEVYKNGLWVDSIVMSMLKSEYDKSNTIIFKR